jgi:hypothetical protein
MIEDGHNAVLLGQLHNSFPVQRPLEPGAKTAFLFLFPFLSVLLLAGISTVGGCGTRGLQQTPLRLESSVSEASGSCRHGLGQTQCQILGLQST